MALLTRILRLCFGGCPHDDLYRERRALHGVSVLHLVCADCGYAVPAVARSPHEHRRVVEEGAVRAARAHRVPVEILAMNERHTVSSIQGRRRARA